MRSASGATRRTTVTGRGAGGAARGVGGGGAPPGASTVVPPWPAPPDYDIADPGLAADGDVRIRYAERAMPLMAGLMQRFAVQRPFEGLAVAACLHVTAE